MPFLLKNTLFALDHKHREGLADATEPQECWLLSFSLSLPPSLPLSFHTVSSHAFIQAHTYADFHTHLRHNKDKYDTEYKNRFF